MHRKSQFLHEGVNVTDQKFSVSLIFGVVKSACTYNLSDDTIIFYGTNGLSDIVNSCLGIDLN